MINKTLGLLGRFCILWVISGTVAQAQYTITWAGPPRSFTGPWTYSDSAVQFYPAMTCSDGEWEHYRGARA
jgi:hypothetical protein